MSISSRDLIDLLEGTVSNAAPLEADTIKTYIDFIDREGVTAELDSDLSKSLQKVRDDFAPYLRPEVASELATIEVYGVDVAAVNAFARLDEDRRQIVIFSGLTDVIIFHAQLRTILNLLQKTRANQVVSVDGWSESEASTFSMAAFTILADFLRGQALISLDGILGPKAAQNVKIGYEASIAFTLVHELAHHVLGHIELGNAVAERNSFSLPIDENINTRQTNELAADEYALMAFHADLRLPLFSSIVFLMGPMAFMEAFAKPAKQTHPLFTNRTARLGSLLVPSNLQDEEAVRVIVDGQINGFGKVSTMRDGSGGDIRNRIFETVPIDLAHRMIVTIMQRLSSEIGVLDV
jgi:hypothetical protein